MNIPFVHNILKMIKNENDKNDNENVVNRLRFNCGIKRSKRP
jgi:hypothetical protein